MGAQAGCGGSCGERGDGVAGWRASRAGAGADASSDRTRGLAARRSISRRGLIGCALFVPGLLILAGCGATGVSGDATDDAASSGDADGTQAEATYPVRTAETHGTRLTTPHYSVLVDEDLFPNDWAYTYNPVSYSLAGPADASDSTASDAAPQWSDELTVMQGGSVAFTVRCCTDNWSGVQGEAASVEVGAVRGQSGWKVVVVVAAGVGAAGDTGDASEAMEEAGQRASVYSALVTLE